MQLKAKFLTACIDLPGLTAREIFLLRELAHAYSMGDPSGWGDAHPEAAPEVAILFVKLEMVMAHVPQA